MRQPGGVMANLIGTVLLCLVPVASASATAPTRTDFASPIAPTQLIDRIVAVVDGEVITLAQLRRATRLSSTDLGTLALCGDVTASDGGNEDPAASTPASGDGARERRVLDCMIDNMLVDRYVRRFPQFSAFGAEVDGEFVDLAAQFSSTQAFEEELERQGMTATEVRYDLGRRHLILNYIDARYRSTVDIREEDSRRYYEEILRPEMERVGEPLPEFEDIERLIRPILIENEVNRRVGDWLADLRRRADIVVYLW